MAKNEILANIRERVRGDFACPKCHIMAGGAKVRGKIGRAPLQGVKRGMPKYGLGGEMLLQAKYGPGFG